LKRQRILGLKGPATAVPFVAILIIMLLTACQAGEPQAPTARDIGIPFKAQKVVVERVVDGDTFVIKGGEKVRLIGINTPESVEPRKPVEYYGKEASKYTQQRIEGKTVFIQLGSTPKDKYDRVLAWVWTDDGSFLNAELVAEGYAQVYTFQDNPEHAEYLLELQRIAREEKRGLWGQP
jgi:micrococcal nuclease